MSKYIFLFSILIYNISATAQVNFTANDQVPSYDTPFLLGANPGYYPGWDDESLADILAGNPQLGLRGVGVRTQRVPLPDEFLEQWGVEVRVDEFEYYESLGMKEHVVFLEGPSDDHRDQVEHCPGEESLLFRNMYEPIWVNGAVNPENYYAKYVHDVVTNYGQFIKTYEVFNEPDFDYSGNGFKELGQDGNWFENIPDPCDIKIQAPIYQYIRMLRITYEVVKSEDPDAFVAIGGIGFPSFLDLVLRHTDNPNQGAVNGSYPLNGGAYFDMLSFHSYPHHNGSLRYWNNDIGDFSYTRHSDAAVQGIIDHKNEFAEVLSNYDYNGINLPLKEYIITETNLPRVAFDEYIGSDEAQSNYLTKLQIASHQHGIRQVHIFKAAESEKEGNMYDSFDAMGFFKSLEDVDQYQQEENECGLASAVMTKRIGEFKFDEFFTAELNLPNHIGGGAFNSKTAVLWAKTSVDQSELATAIYSFPDDWSEVLGRITWDDFDATEGEIIGLQNVSLTGRPTIFRALELIGGAAKDISSDIFIYPNIIETGTSITLKNDIDLQITLVDQLGRVLDRFEKGVGQHDLTLAISDPGVYFLRMRQEGNFYTERIFVF